MSRPTRKFLLGGKFSMGLMGGVIISLGLFHGLIVPQDKCFGHALMVDSLGCDSVTDKWSLDSLGRSWLNVED